MAEEQYEQALAMGLPYDVAVQQGQYAMEVSEQEFEAKVNEKEAYASEVGQQAFEAAQAMGLPYEAAVAAGQKAQDSAESHYDEVTEGDRTPAERSC